MGRYTATDSEEGEAGGRVRQKLRSLAAAGGGQWCWAPVNTTWADFHPSFNGSPGARGRGAPEERSSFFVESSSKVNFSEGD